MHQMIKLLIAMLIGLILNGCAYYSYSTRSTYGLTKIETVEYLGHVQYQGLDSPIFNPIITFDNGVQIRVYVPGIYNYPLTETDSKNLNNLKMSVFITSLKAGIHLDIQHIKMDQYRMGYSTPINFVELKRYPSWREGQEGVELCQYPPNMKMSDFYDFYQGATIDIPFRQHDFNLLPSNLLRIDTNILCGSLVAMNTNLAGEQGFFTLTLPFVEEGKTTEYILYFNPVNYRILIK